MIIDTILLSKGRDTVIRLNDSTQLQLSGRILRRSATGGRFFVVENDSLTVRLDPAGMYRDQELTLTPPVSIGIGGRQFAAVTLLRFVGETMQVESDEDPQRRESVHQLSDELRSLNDREQSLRQELQRRQEALRRLEQENAAQNHQITQLEKENAALENQIALLTQTGESLQAQRSQLETAQGALHDAKRQLKQTQEQLSSAKQTEARLNRDLKAAVQENKVVSAANRKLEEDLAQARTAHEELRRQEAQLTDELKACSPDILEELRAAIAEQQNQYETASNEQTNLLGEQRVWIKRLEEQLGENEQLSRQIAQQPEALRSLQEAHEALSRRLRETINAQEMCSEEKQAKLREQIAQREPLARQLREQHEALQAQAAEVDRIIAGLTESQDAQLLALWPELTRAMTAIRQSISGTNAELENLQAQASQFEQHVQACADRLEQLREWYRVDQTPLQRLQQRLGDLTPSENEQLLSTMNPASIDRIRLLFESVESGLTDLDGMLKQVIQAAQSDERFVALKTATNDQHARQEMKRS